MWNSGLVKRRFTSRYLLAALACLGLILAPLAAPAVGSQSDMAASSFENASVDMPDGMPCCPDLEKKPTCAKDCPFMAVCAGSAFPPLTNSSVFSVPITLLAVIAPRDAIKLSGLAPGPPAKPPKA
jgi:hypothetical protein